jgi:DNA-binding transcriptional regulator YiaG
VKRTKRRWGAACDLQEKCLTTPEKTALFLGMTRIEVRTLRKKVKVSQRKFAGLLGVGLRTVQNWENGGAVSKQSTKLLRQLQTFFP